MNNQKKVINGLKMCWRCLNALNGFFTGPMGNPAVWRHLKMALKDIEYGFTDTVRELSPEG
jgi:hypothetical protein